MSNSSFSLKSPPKNNALFMPTAAAVAGDGNIINIPAHKIRHYRNHKFTLYTGERFSEMVESIKDYGILSPLIIIPLSPDEVDGEYEYEVFIGHNRLECGKSAGLTEIPCIIREGLAVSEIDVISKISNLLQRGLSDLPHSERAEAIATYYNEIKQQGRRTDLIREVEALISGETNESPEITGCDGSISMGKKSIEVAGEKFGLSKNSVARYVRVNDLIPEFKVLLDSEELSIRAGVSLSYLDEARQQSLLAQLQRYEMPSVSMKQAEQLRQLHANINADDDSNGEEFLLGCADILVGRIETDNTPKLPKTINFKLDRQAVASYFKEDDTEEAMQETVLQALAFYHQHYDQYKNAVDER